MIRQQVSCIICRMRKTRLSGCVAAAVLSGVMPVAAAMFPLEWNATYDTSVPREVEILPGKLVGMGLMREGDGFKVQADGKPLAVQALKGKEPGSVRLRFAVPSGTKTLQCETCADGGLSFCGVGHAANVSAAPRGGLFAGALSDTAGWRFKGGTIEKTQKGLLLKGGKNRSYATYEVPVPDSLAGKGVVQEIEVTSRAKLVWGGVVKIEQLDGNGNVLPETLCDIRWTSHMRPPEKTALYVDEGHVHPYAKRLRASFELRPLRTEFDDYGRPIKDKSILLPALEVSRLEVRAAEPLPFPKWDDGFFAPGVSGRAGDFAYACHRHICTDPHRRVDLQQKQIQEVSGHRPGRRGPGHGHRNDSGQHADHHQIHGAYPGGSHAFHALDHRIQSGEGRHQQRGDIPGIQEDKSLPPQVISAKNIKWKY